MNKIIHFIYCARTYTKCQNYTRYRLKYCVSKISSRCMYNASKFHKNLYTKYRTL